MNDLKDARDVPVHIVRNGLKIMEMPLGELPGQTKYIFVTVKKDGRMSHDTFEIQPLLMMNDLESSMYGIDTVSHLEARPYIGYSPRSDADLTEGAD